MHKLVLIAVFSCLLVSCASQDGVGEYRVATIGNANRSVTATVLSVKQVRIVRRTSGAGAQAGGALGGALAAESSDNAAIIIAGIIGGAIIGNNIEASAGVLQGHEYLLETETGKLLTVAQPDSGNDILGVGTPAILVYGYPHRLTRDPR